MSDTIPVAGAIGALVDADLLVVEAEPESELTRSLKGIARHVYRFVQDVRWSGSEHAVAVRIVGDPRHGRPIGVNVGVLLAPLLDVALESDPAVASAFETGDAGPDAIDRYPSPRDGIWLVPRKDLGSGSVTERFGLTIGWADSSAIAVADLVLITVPAGSVAAPVPDAELVTEFAAVIVDAPTTDHPPEYPVASPRG